MTEALSDELVLTGAATPPLRLLRELIAAREVVVTLARKTFFVQYRRAVLGLFWAVFLPVFQAVVLSIVFTRVARFDVPRYPAYVLSGMVPWSYFSMSLIGGATSIVDNSSLSTKIYFPRSALPLSVCMANAYSLLIGSGVLLVFASAFGATPGWRTFLMVPAALLDLWLATSFALVLSVAHVYLRDTRYIVQAAMLGWLCVTPVVYPIGQLHGWLHRVVELNPVTGVVALYHSAVYEAAIDETALLSTCVWVIALTALAVTLHSRYDRVVADLL